jgi:S1-C subfamily serine protease
VNDEQTPQYPEGQYPAGQSSEPAQTPGSGGATPPADDRAAQRPVAPGANWTPEPWVESDPARHWAQGSELTPAESAPTQPLYEPPLRAATTGVQLQGPARAISAGLLALVLIVGAFLAGRGLTLAAQNNGSTSQGPVVVSTSGASSNSSVSSNLNAEQLQAAVVSVADKVEESVVTVHSSGSVGSAIGSGEFVTSDGYIATNNHVVDGFSSYSVTLSDGTNLNATLVGEDPQDDLAVLKVNTSNAPAITLADSSAAKVGEFVVAIGSPLGQSNTKTFGIISALNRTETEEGDGISSSAGPILTGMIQTSAALAPGNSGGALVDLDGKMVGMPTLAETSGTGRQSSSTSTIGFAISSNRVAYVVNQLIHSGKLTSTNQGFLGVSTRAAGNGFTSQGVAVAGFTQDAHGATPAQSAGLQVGDVIVAVNGQTITSEEDLAGAVLSRTPGTKISVEVQRGNGQQTIQVTLGERPTNVSA